jgi:hypothetical protein
VDDEFSPAGVVPHAKASDRVELTGLREELWGRTLVVLISAHIKERVFAAITRLRLQRK